MDEVIRESDLIQLDGTIDKLIKQLTELNAAYGSTVEAMRLGAESIVRSLKSASGATTEGRKTIDNAAVAVNRYERAMYELEFAMSETGKQVAWLKEQTREVNRVTIDQRKQLEAAAGSYNKIKADVKELTALYKSLSEAERNEASFGQEIVAELQAKNAQLKELEKAIKPVVEQMTRLQKAEQELAYWQSEEGQKLLEVKKQIREITSARKEAKAVVDPLAAAQEKYSRALNEETQQIRELNFQTKRINTERDLEAKVNTTVAGSYNRLSAEYELTKFRLKNMSNATEEGRREIEETQEALRGMYAEMRQFQEATGVYSLGVGDYAQSWGGLGYSVQQVVRELPAATVSLNTFFLAISNNIPILIDEINRARLANKQMLAEGKQTVPVSKQIVKALFSWQSALVIVLTALSMYGKQMIEWADNVFKGKNAALELGKAMKNIAEEMGSTNDNYGQNMITLRKLREEYSGLKTEAEKTKWIEDNKDAWQQLNVAIYDTSDADALLIENTTAIKKAFQDRARAADSYKIVQEKYEKLLQEEEQLRQIQAKGASAFRMQGMQTGMTTPAMPGSIGSAAVPTRIITPQEQYDAAVKAQEKKIQGMEKEIDLYYELGRAAEQASNQVLGIYTESDKEGSDREKQLRDLTDYINNMKLRVAKKYTSSITELERDEFAKRRKEAQEAYDTGLIDLQNMYDKNERILADADNKYKDLTDEQLNTIRESQIRIGETIINLREELNQTLEEIDRDREINSLKILEEGLNLRLSAVKKGSQEEVAIQLQLLRKQRQIALLENAKLPESQRVSEDDINASFNKQATNIGISYAQNTFEQRLALEEAKFKAVQHTEREITQFTLEQERKRRRGQLNLAKAGLLDWSQTQIETAEATVAGIDRELAKLSGFQGFIGQVEDKGLTGGILESLGFDDASISAFQQAVNTVINNINAIVEAEIKAAEAAVEAAKERVNAAQSAYDAEIEARNNGYANSVETARKELEQERRNQEEKQRLLEEAQRRQEQINSITQTSSLITAAAQLWSAMSSIPVVGPGLAIAAIATMFGSFIAAKARANQIASQEYGEGGLEFLEGGSHASGNDIDLGVNNRKNRRMKAEGGEALAIINKKNTKRYRKILPDVIESFNDGTFQDKYIKAFTSPNGLSMFFEQPTSIDLSCIENDVQNIRKQNELRTSVLPDGTVITQYKNVKRIVRKS